MDSSNYYNNRIMSIINQVSILGVGQAKPNGIQRGIKHLLCQGLFIIDQDPHFTRREKENKESRRLYRPLIKEN